MIPKLKLETVNNEHETLRFQFKLLMFDWLLNQAGDNNNLKHKIILFLEAVRSHFKNEDNILELIDFPEKEAHQEAHRKLIDEMTGDIDGILGLKTFDEFKKRLWAPYEAHILEWDDKIEMLALQEGFVISPQPKQTEEMSKAE